MENVFFKADYVYESCRFIHYVDCTMKWNVGPIKKGQVVAIIVIRGTHVDFYKYHNGYEHVYTCELMKMQSSVRKIQRVWRRCISDPSYKVCKKRLLYEFQDM